MGKLKGHGEKQSRKRQMAIAALLSEPTLGKAAQKTGIGVTTLVRWMNQPDFRTDYQQACDAVLDAAVNRLKRVADKAVEALERNVEDKAPAPQQVAAAKAVLDSLVKRRVEHSGPDGGPIAVAALDPESIKALSDEELGVLKRAIRKLGRGDDPGRGGPPSS